MAAAARIVSLNLGSQRLSLALFQPHAHGGLVLEAFRQREILADPATDADRQERWSVALREMMSELGLGDGAVNYAVSGQSVFARFVKLPAVDEEKIERIITFEAQQNVLVAIESGYSSTLTEARGDLTTTAIQTTRLSRCFCRI